jgi:hypothetical protein
MLENLRKMLTNVFNMPQRCYMYRSCDVDVVALKMLHRYHTIF